MTAIRVHCPPMDTVPTSFWTPWLRRTAELECDVFVGEVLQWFKVVFPPLYVRWWFGKITVDAGQAKDDEPGNIYLIFPAEPVERVDRDTMRVLPVPVTGQIAFGDDWHEIVGMTLPYCYAHRDPNRRGVFVVDAVDLVGTI